MLTKNLLLVGVSHHMQTTIFGCALLVNETVKMYTWVLKTLIGAMNNKMPMLVVTDGDKAMRAAIEKYFQLPNIVYVFGTSKGTPNQT